MDAPETGYNSPSIDSISSDSKRANRRRLALLALLLLLLALLAFGTYYYLQNRSLPIPRIGGGGAEDVVEPPQYVFSIAGPVGNDALARPIGVAVSEDGRVYVTDTKADTIRVYNIQGRYLTSFAAIEDGENAALRKPAHVAISPTNELYVTDRQLRAVYVFDLDGNYLRKILPDAETAKLWGPLGMGFDNDGNLVVTDVGDTENHRVFVFTPEGEEIKRFGSTGKAEQMSQFPGQFYFPNGVEVADDGRLYIGDSDNRRVQIFDENEEFEKFIRTAGIPRGLVIDSEERIYVVDALGHLIDVYTLEGEKITSFGGPGTGPGQFRFANDVALDANERIYVTDRDNQQVQVWEWPEAEIKPPVAPESPVQWALCLLPLLLFPLIWLLARRRRFAVTEDFVNHLVALEKVPLMDRWRFRWLTPMAEWPVFDGRVEQDVNLGQIIHAEEHSDSDARHIQAQLKVSMDDAILLSIAKRSKGLCTEDERIGYLALQLGVEVYDAPRFVRTFDRGRGKSKGTENAPQ